MFQVQVKMEHLVFQPKNHQILGEFSYITWFKYLRDQNQVRFKVFNLNSLKFDNINFQVRIMKRILIILTTIFLIGCEEEPTKYTLTVTTNPTEGGTINPTSGEYEEGTEVTIRVNTNTNYEFDKWSGSWSGLESPLTLTMDSDKNLVGNFKLIDTDGDGVTDSLDQCNDTPSGQTVDSNGCSDSQKDSDVDGVNDDVDTCPDTPSGETVDSNGCSDSQIDTDGDGVTDDIDTCPDTPSGRIVDENGCSNPIYLDSNGVTIKSYDWGEIGDTGVINGTTYLIVSEEEFRQKIYDGEDVSNVCTSKVSNMNNLFSNSQFNGDISTWDVSNVNSMEGMFFNSQFNGDISNWDVSNVTDMSTMFKSEKFNGDISNWDVSNVKDMSDMFSGYGDVFINHFNGDISNWDVSNVTDMKNMFSESEFNGDISNWNVSSVTSMSGMFGSSPFNGDISNWDVSSVTSMSGMFGNSQFNGDISN